MNFFRRVSLAAIFVLLSGMLFTALMPLVLRALTAFYGHYSINPPDAVFVASWVGIAMASAVATVAAVFYLLASVRFARGEIVPSRTIV